MVRFNKEKGTTGVYNIDTKEDTITETTPTPPPPKEPIVTQASNAELEKFAALVLKVMGDENIPPTPNIFKSILTNYSRVNPLLLKNASMTF